MILRNIIIGASLVLLCGCSSMKSTKKSTEIAQDVETIVEPQRSQILYPEQNGNNINRVVPKGVTAKKQSTQGQQTPKQTPQPTPKQTPQPTPKPTPQKTVKFTNVESANIRVPGINPLPSGGLTLALQSLESDFCYPYHGELISNYGQRGRSMHTGVDIKAIPNDTIRAAMSGVVRMSKYYSGYGNLLVIHHECGIETVYGHNSKNLVQANDMVRTGQPIALAGRTGRATTEHLHFEVRVAGEHIDPNKFIDCHSYGLQQGSLYLAHRNGRVVASNNVEISTERETASTPVVSTPTPSQQSKPAALTNASSNDAAAYHRVVQGDTLSKIARDYSTTIAKLCNLNNISKTHVLQLKQRIRVK